MANFQTDDLLQLSKEWGNLLLSPLLWLDKHHPPLAELRFYASLLGLGAISGFIVKKYLRFMVCCMLFSLLACKSLEHIGWISVNWSTINLYLGLGAYGSLEQWSQEMYLLCLQNNYACGAYLIGLFIGYRAG